jgi:hypothetical protein
MRADRCSGGGSLTRPAYGPVDDLFALVLVEPAPDPVRLTDPDGVVEAVLKYGARPADLLGGALTGYPLFFALGT